MSDESGSEAPPPEPRRGYKDSLDPADHLRGKALSVFRVLTLTGTVIIALVICAFAVCAVNFRE